LKWILGTLGLVTFANELASLPEDVIQPRRQPVDRLNVDTSKYCKKFTPGDRAMLQSGPFAGYQAIFDSYISGHERVQVLLKMLQNTQIKLDLAWAAAEHDNMYRSNSS
jgi:transcription antitermination factor NusG